MASGEGLVGRVPFGTRGSRPQGGRRGERARARCRSRGILSELKESPLTIPKKNSGGVSIPPPDPSYDQRKGFGPSFGNLPGVTGNGKLRPCGGREDPDPRPFVGAEAYDRRPNFGTKFGRQGPCLRYIGPQAGAPSAPVGGGLCPAPPGVAGHSDDRVGADLCVRPLPRPRRPRLPCAKGAVARRATEGLSEVAGYLGMISATIPTPSSHPRRRRSALRRWPGRSMGLSLLS